MFTDEGVLGRVRWEDRNRRGLGNTLYAELDAGTQIQRLALGYQVRHFRSNRQTLNFTFEGANEERDAFESTRIGGRTWVDRRLTEGVTFSYGIALRFDEVTQKDTTETYGLLSFPVTLRVDRSNDLLNPTRGWRFSAHAEPFLDVGGVGSYFLKTELGASHYWPIGTGDRLIIAHRIRLGSIVGASRESIPANERFYSGGGSSLRGYNYLTVSPLDGQDPIGGRSVLEASLELRRAITNTIGLVAFVDAGAAFDSEYPDFGESFRYGAGLGVRYFSPIGPLRFDVAVPLNKRSIDDRYEIYLSIGQAF
jgi:translocation and assembly module TamA